MRMSPLAAILSAGVIAGTVDIGAASLINWLNPVVILHAIASGLLGKPAFYGGTQTAVLGLGLQWGMSIVIAAVYISVAQAAPALKRVWLPGGLAYGVVIFFVMNDVVVPLSNAWPKGRHMPPDKFAENMLAMLLFGTIVAWGARETTATPADQR
jgi:uncharacterized membrane protein YagU involved in acid resistance